MARSRTPLPPAGAILRLLDADGRLAVRVSPGASADAVTLPPAGGAIAVRVTAPPEEGKANDAVLRLLARALQRPPSSLELVRGATGRTKLIRLKP